MGPFRFLPSTTRSRLALAGAITLIYVVGSTVYMRYGSSAFPMLETKPDDLGHKPAVGTAKPTSDTAQTSPESIAAAPSRVLLVSSFFPLNTSKTPQKDYDLWLYNYLGTVETDIYFYTTPEQADRVKSFRPEGLNMTLDTTFSSIFDVPPLKDKVDAYTQNRKKDRARPRHSIASYAVMNSKPFFLTNAVKASEAKGTKYDYAFWSDATGFHHEHEYRHWPSPSRLDELWATGSNLTGTDPADLLFIPTWDLPHKSMFLWYEGQGPIEHRFTEATFFGGRPKAIDWLARAFYSYHDAYLDREMFIGKDQLLLNSLALLYSSHFTTVWYNDPAAPARAALNRTPSVPWPLERGPNDDADELSALGQCDSEWFYYRFFLADDAERQRMRDIWIAKANRWRWWGWWRPRDTTPCQPTRLLAMIEPLKRKFGQGWNSPAHNLHIPDTIHWTLPTSDNTTSTN